MRTLGWLNVAHALLLVAALAVLFAQPAVGPFEPARLSEPALFRHWSDMFVQLGRAVVPLAALLYAQLLAFGALRTRDERRRRRARAWCVGVVLFYACYLLQVAALGAFDAMAAPQVVACVAGLAAVVAVCALDAVKLAVSATAGRVAPTPGFEPGTR